MDIRGFKSKDGTVHEYDYNALANKPVISDGTGGSVDLTGVVKSVNGSAPDRNGNVVVNIPTDEYINNLINTALGVIENGSY